MVTHALITLTDSSLTRPVQVLEDRLCGPQIHDHSSLKANQRLYPSLNPERTNSSGLTFDLPELCHTLATARQQ